MRAFIAIAIFVTAVFLSAMMVTEGFSWLYLLGAIACFITAYFTWPSKKRGQRDRDCWYYDTCELLIELPIEFLLWLFRLLGRLFRSNDGGFDIDL